MVMDRPDGPPWLGAGGAGRLQVRRAGVTRSGDTPFMSMGAGRAEVSLRVINRDNVSWHGQAQRRSGATAGRDATGGAQRASLAKMVR